MKRKYLIIITTFILNNLVFASPWDGIDGYYAKPISINTTSDYSLIYEECEIKGVSVHTTYDFMFDRKNEIVNAEIEFYGTGATGTLSESFPIPKSLIITIDGNEIDYEILYENKKLKLEESKNYDVRIPGIVKFSFISNSENKIELHYLNDPICVMSGSEIIYTFYSGKIEDKTKYKLVLLNNGDGKISILDQKISLKKINENRREIEFQDEDFDKSNFNNYPGNTISLILRDFKFGEEFFNPDTFSFAKIDERWLLSLTKEQLRLFRNMFYAKHGYAFKDESLRKYFEDIPDFNYKVNPKFSEKDFNEIEKQNIELIKKYENLVVNN